MNNLEVTLVALNTPSATNDATYQPDSDDGFVCLTLRLNDMDEVTLARLKKKFPRAIKD